MNKQGIIPEPVDSYRKVRVYTETGKMQRIHEQVMLTVGAADEYNSLGI